MTLVPSLSRDLLAQRTFAHLQRVVAVDSQSDERSTSIPSSEGQRRLAALVGGQHARWGATVEHDAHANVLAWYPGRGRRAGDRPWAFLVHLDTARGTHAVPALTVRPAWDGSPLTFPANPDIRVDLATFPAVAPFVGLDVVHGPGDQPFGLDDKLGLAECLALAELLAEHPEVEHPPLVFVARPDEEIGRHEAVVGLAERLAAAGVVAGYTIDGIWPFEINVENFEAAVTGVLFPTAPVPPGPGAVWAAKVGGVNTHGATAAAEGHRAAPRLVAEWRAAVAPADATFVGFVSDALRDCDAVVHVRVSPGAEDRVRGALAAVMEPHLARGASWSFAPSVEPTSGDGAVEAMLAWLQRFYASDPGFTLPCEASSGRDGYSHPYRARPTSDGLRLDVRLRDFDPAGLERRIAHVRAQGAPVEATHQYVNMGPRLAPHPELVRAAQAAAADIGVQAPVQPIRGGTGVDPFLDRGVPVANLGTGYFAPESEKELTALQVMADHVRWLFALVQRLP